MRIGIDIDGVLIDDDIYRLDTMTKYCYEKNLGFYSVNCENVLKYSGKLL